VTGEPKRDSVDFRFQASMLPGDVLRQSGVAIIGAGDYGLLLTRKNDRKVAIIDRLKGFVD
jgi:hypothetical protein